MRLAQWVTRYVTRARVRRRELCAHARTRHAPRQHATAPADAVLRSICEPGFQLKIFPHVDGTPRVCELVKFSMGDVTLRGAWTGPAALDLHPHALAPVAELPVLEIVSAVHFVVDLTLQLGTVVKDYLKT